MSYVVRAKEGVKFDAIAPAGFAILAALSYATGALSCDLVITSGTDGVHSGPNDPHHLGSAYDVRSQDLPVDKDVMLRTIMEALGQFTPDSGGYITKFFFGWLEDAGTENEHFHIQLRHGAVYS